MPPCEGFPEANEVSFWGSRGGGMEIIMYTSFRPGKTWYDTEGKRIQAHGGSIIYANDTFYWYGENKENITGTATGERCEYWHHGVRCYSSKDLYNWQDEGMIVPESDDGENPFFPAHIMDRPHILYNEKTQKFVLWAKTSKKGRSFETAKFSLCVGDSLHSLKYVGDIDSKPHFAGDFDLFVHENKAYAIFEYPHTEMIVRELNEEYTGFAEKWSTHLPLKNPPFVREAPAYFKRNGRSFILTSGTTGYYPNSTIAYDITDLHGEWNCLGLTCKNDVTKTSFHTQFSSVFKHPTIPDLYIAIGDRWLTDLTEDLPDMDDVFFDRYDPRGKKQFNWEDLKHFSDENTSEADYVWLPVMFDENGNPYIEWRRVWRIDEFKKQ